METFLFPLHRSLPASVLSERSTIKRERESKQPLIPFSNIHQSYQKGIHWLGDLLLLLVLPHFDFIVNLFLLLLLLAAR